MDNDICYDVECVTVSKPGELAAVDWIDDVNDYVPESNAYQSYLTNKETWYE